MDVLPTTPLDIFIDQWGDLRAFLPSMGNFKERFNGTLVRLRSEPIILKFVIHCCKYVTSINKRIHHAISSNNLTAHTRVPPSILIMKRNALKLSITQHYHCNNIVYRLGPSVHNSGDRWLTLCQWRYKSTFFWW